MNLIRAEAKAKGLVKELEPFCDRIEIVGNIRRRKQSVGNIDILLLPKGAMLFLLMAKIIEMGSLDGMKIADSKSIKLEDEFEEIVASLWFTTLDKWPAMLLVKTGGMRSNKRIEILCGQRKWRFLPKDGVILNEKGEKLPIKEEEDIYKLLEIPYLKPEERE